MSNLTKWGRFTLVADAEGADLTLTLTKQPTTHVNILVWGGGLRNVAVNSWFMSITAGDTVLYGTTFSGTPDKELKKLRKRLEEGVVTP